MDRAEAKDILNYDIRQYIKQCKDATDEDFEALDLAIEALEKLQLSEEISTNGTYIRDGRLMHDLVYRGEAEPCKGDAESATTTDCISRAAAIAYIDRITNSGIGKNKSLDYIRKYIYALPPVNQKQITGKLESVENATSEGEESTMNQPKSKLYIPLNEYTVDRINRLHKNDCGDYFDEEWLYNELEQIAEILQLSPETSTNDLISRQAAIDAVEKAVFKGVAKSAIESLPPVEPAPVCEDAIEALSAERTGEWIPCTKGGLPLTELGRRERQKWYGYKCSKCNFIYKGNALTESPFCQNCGAKMKG